MECPNCAGNGNIKAYSHVAGGICFNCNGTGRIADSNRSKGNFRIEVIRNIRQESNGGLRCECAFTLWRDTMSEATELAETYLDTGEVVEVFKGKGNKVRWQKFSPNCDEQAQLLWED